MGKRIYLTGQNNFGNRGCEALVRSTVALLRQHLGDDVEVRVPSHDIPRDSAQWPEAAANGVTFVPAPTVPRLYTHWNRLCRYVPGWNHLPWPGLGNQPVLADELAACDAVLSIGGDNYSLDYDLGSFFLYVSVAEAALRLGKPVILWGASVGPFSALPPVEKRMTDHLSRLSLITVRETDSFEYLRKIGVSKNVIQLTDSAFLLQPQFIDTAGFWPKNVGNGVIGLNLSPVIQRLLASKGLTGVVRKEVARFIRHAITEWDFSFILVPHVSPLNGVGTNNDSHYMMEVMEELKDVADRVTIAPSGLNATQTKYIISQCRFFAGARTHATVAAMSTGVPVISIAYSVKAYGINRDLFGHERYVLKTDSLSFESLTQSIQMLIDEEAEIRALLTERIPLWKDRCHEGARWLAKRIA